MGSHCPQENNGWNLSACRVQVSWRRETRIDDDARRKRERRTTWRDTPPTGDWSNSLKIEELSDMSTGCRGNTKLTVTRTSCGNTLRTTLSVCNGLVVRFFLGKRQKNPQYACSAAQKHCICVHQRHKEDRDTTVHRKRLP